MAGKQAEGHGGQGWQPRGRVAPPSHGTEGLGFPVGHPLPVTGPARLPRHQRTSGPRGLFSSDSCRAAMPNPSPRWEDLGFSETCPL